MRKVTLPTKERNALQWAIEEGLVNARPFVPRPNAVNPVANHSGVLKTTKDCKDWIEQFHAVNEMTTRNIKRLNKYKGSVWNYLNEVNVRRFFLEVDGQKILFYILTNEADELVGYYFQKAPTWDPGNIVQDAYLLRQATTTIDASKFAYSLGVQNFADILNDPAAINKGFSAAGFDSMCSSFDFEVCKAAFIRKDGYIEDDFRTEHLPYSLHFLGEDIMEATFFPPKLNTATSFDELKELAREILGTMVARNMPEFIHLDKYIEVDRNKSFSTIEEFAEMNGIELTTF